MAAVGLQEMMQWAMEEFLEHGDVDGFNQGLLVFALGVQEVPISSTCTETDCFKLTLDDIHPNNEEENPLLNRLVFNYDWSMVMERILEATRDYMDPDDIEMEATWNLYDWLPTLQGWGLLSHLVSIKEIACFNVALLYSQAHWDEATRGECTAEAVFAHVKDFYHSEVHDVEVPAGIAKNIDALVPDVSVSIYEMTSEVLGDERKKKLILTFGIQWDLAVHFVLEKKRVNKCLVDLAAEAVAMRLENKGSITELQIPGTLTDNIYDKFKDCEWIRQHGEFMEDGSIWDTDEEDGEEAGSDQDDENEGVVNLPDV